MAEPMDTSLFTDHVLFLLCVNSEALRLSYKMPVYEQKEIINCAHRIGPHDLLVAQEKTGASQENLAFDFFQWLLGNDDIFPFEETFTGRPLPIPDYGPLMRINMERKERNNDSTGGDEKLSVQGR